MSLPLGLQFLFRKWLFKPLSFERHRGRVPPSLLLECLRSVGGWVLLGIDVLNFLLLIDSLTALIALFGSDLSWDFLLSIDVLRSASSCVHSR